MAVYIDDALIPATVGRLTSRWSHLYADDLDELHEFAARVGMKRAWFQDKRVPHYDLTERRREVALKLGAIPTTWKEFGKRAFPKEVT